MMTAIDKAPILFTGPLVVKIFEDLKTVTRRVVDPRLWPIIEEIEKVNGKLVWQCADFDLKCRYDHEQLYVRETFAAPHKFDGHKPREIPEGTRIHYRASEPGSSGLMWRPSIFMPRWASRLDLRVKEIKLERVQDITDAEAEAEGVDTTNASVPGFLRERFRRLWDSINEARGFGWESNPPVWAIRFKRI